MCWRDIQKNNKFLSKEEFIKGCLQNKNMMDLISPFEI